VATALIGILLIAQLSGVALLSWLVPVVVFLGLLLLAGAIAEVFKIRVGGGMGGLFLPCMWAPKAPL
jgi:hypothetical protein